MKKRLLTLIILVGSIVAFGQGNNQTKMLEAVSAQTPESGVANYFIDSLGELIVKMPDGSLRRTVSIPDGDASKMNVQSSGNVGIGTATPMYKLDVNGNISSSGNMRTDNNMFATSYRSESDTNCVIECVDGDMGYYDTDSNKLVPFKYLKSNASSSSLWQDIDDTASLLNEDAVVFISQDLLLDQNLYIGKTISVDSKKANIVAGTSSSTSADFNIVYGETNGSDGDFSFLLGKDIYSDIGYNLVVGSDCTAEAPFCLVSGNGAYAYDSVILAMGIGIEAVGKYSFALGKDIATDGGISHFAHGTNLSINGGDHVVAIGDIIEAEGTSFSFGVVVENMGDFNLALGEQIHCEGDYNVLVGLEQYIVNGGSFNTLLGQGHLIDGESNSAFGSGQEIEADYCFVAGFNNDISVDNSTVIGVRNEITSNSGISNYILGDSNTLDYAFNCITMGSRNNVSGSYSNIQGSGNESDMSYGVIHGSDNYLSGRYGYLFGHNNSAEEIDYGYNTIIGTENSIDGDFSFIAGSGNKIENSHSYIIGARDTLLHGEQYAIGNSLTGRNNEEILLGFSNDTSSVSGESANRLLTLGKGGNSNALIIWRNGDFLFQNENHRAQLDSGGLSASKFYADTLLTPGLPTDSVGLEQWQVYRVGSQLHVKLQ